MTDRNQRLWQLVAEFEARLDGDTQAVVRAVQAELAKEGFQGGGDSEAIIRQYIDDFEAALRAGITSATALGVAGGTLRSEQVARLARQAFTERWEDGKILSDRLWWVRGNTLKGFRDVLDAGIEAGQSASDLIYDMQRAIERAAGGEKFDIVVSNLDDWAAQLGHSAKTLVHTPQGASELAKLLRRTKADIGRLADNGTKHAAQTFVKRIEEAFKAADEKLIGEAISWWFYDKQLYQLRRIARTELATAQHRAVIASTIDDPDVIGYQWRLSSSHPEPDICDWYANIDMGLGRGVWTKEAVPRYKAHPHCMCSISARVTKVRQAGSRNYGDFIRGLPPEKRAVLLPKWARDALAAGTKLNELIRPDGMGLVERPSKGN